MKLKLFDRILLAILLIAAIVVSLILLSMATRLISESAAVGFVALFYHAWQNSLILAGVGIVVLLIAVRLLFAGRSTSLQQPTAALIRQSETGGSYITLSAIDSMAQKHCRTNKRICECYTSVRQVEGGVSIGVRIHVLPDTDVVELCDSLQNTIKQYIESYTGVTVKEVGVMVESMTAQGGNAIAPRVE